MSLPLATLTLDPANPSQGFVRAGSRFLGSVCQSKSLGWSWHMADGHSALGCYWDTAEKAAELVAKAWGTRLEEA